MMFENDIEALREEFKEAMRKRVRGYATTMLKKIVLSSDGGDWVECAFAIAACDELLRRARVKE